MAAKKGHMNGGANDEAPRQHIKRSNGNAKRATKTAATSMVELSRRLAAAAPAVVVKAAMILEEELAGGIGAARRIEQRFLDVDALRTHRSDAVMSKFRRDAHDAVDIILDVLTAAAQTVSAQAVRFVNVTASAAEHSPGTDLAPEVHVAALRVPGQVAPGTTGEVSMSLENASDSATSSFTLHCSDLVSASGAKIAASCISFAPQTLGIGPKQAGRVTISVSIPSATPAGAYEGLVRAKGLENLRAMLTVAVS